MALFDSGLMRLVTDKMSYLGQRQAVLAQNVANVNTPGYKAKDLTPFTFSDALKESSGAMRVTDVNHMLPASMDGVNASAKKARTFETVPSGNSVEIEQQMMAVSQTAIDYQAVAGIYHKMMGLFRTAIGK